ncbi:hypothetical protein BFG60_0412 [Microcystis aeruginosa NIES-98]|nr:hypothetical protein BFG60_0412 [Microcystis aeruginosa NIES-98]
MLLCGSWENGNGKAAPNAIAINGHQRNDHNNLVKILF